MTNYRELTEQQTDTLMRGLKYHFSAWLGNYYHQQCRARQNDEEFVGPVGISDAEGNFLIRAEKKYEYNKLACFRMTMKVHKKPWKMRPIVCCAGTFMNDWSKWLNYQLQKCKPVVSSYLHDDQQALDEISGLQLPPNAKLGTADANSMYNYIDTDHACTIIEGWLWDMAALLGNDFPVEAIIEAMNIIMRNNVF